MIKNNPGDPAVDALSEEELAKYFYEHRDDESIWESKAYILPSGKPSTAVFQLRIDPSELTEIAQASFANGGNVSEFFRTAALDKARAMAGRPGPSADELTKALAKVKALVDELQAELASVSATAPKKTSRGRKKASVA